MNKTLVRSAVVAAATMLAAVTANAATLAVTWTNDTTTFPTTAFNPAPNSVSGTGTFTNSAMGSIGSQQQSPWTGSATPGATYSCVDCAMTPPGTGPETVTYNNTAGTTTFSILWGTPDSYNNLELIGSLGDTFNITGSTLAASAGIQPSTSFDWVTFTITGETLASVQLSDNGTAAFEYADVTFTPLPAALPLFAGGLGMIGLLGRRRKRKGAAIPA
jgi:hypothetical protein